ncbi:50S ribosomal protein L14e [Candidatus Woesearchaeota archaeon]|nr:50S ribosomal protein L14e [Candidatus Woesearchaeota archaeon]
MSFEAGRVCVKKAGREAGKYCVVLEELDGNFVLIDGEAARRKCNTSHLEPIDVIVDVKKGSDKQDVMAELKKAGLLKEKKKKTIAKKERKTSKNAKTKEKKTNAGKKE